MLTGRMHKVCKQFYMQHSILAWGESDQIKADSTFQNISTFSSLIAATQNEGTADWLTQAANRKGKFFSITLNHICLD